VKRENVMKCFVLAFDKVVHSIKKCADHCKVDSPVQEHRTPAKAKSGVCRRDAVVVHDDYPKNKYVKVGKSPKQVSLVVGL